MPQKHDPVFDFLMKHRWVFNAPAQDSPTSSSIGTSPRSQHWPTSLGVLNSPTESGASHPPGWDTAPSIRLWKKPKPTPNAEDTPNVEVTPNVEDSSTVEDTISELVVKGKRKRGGARGIVTTEVSERWVRQNNRKIKLGYDTEKHIILTEFKPHRLMMDIGSIVRSFIPMVGMWTDLDESGRLVLWDQLTSLYEFPEDPVVLKPLVIRLEQEAKVKYTDWKNECKEWWTWYKGEELKKGNDPKDVIPREFLLRSSEWKNIRAYWDSTLGVKRSEHGEKARKGHDLKMRGGSRRLYDTAESFKAGDTIESQTPYCSAGMKYFPIDDPHEPTRKRGQMFLAAQKDYLDAIALTQEPGVDATPLTPMVEEAMEIDAIIKHMGKSEGQFQSGLGRKRPVKGMRDGVGSSSAFVESSQKVEHLTRLVEDQQQRLSQLDEERERVLAQMTEERERQRVIQEESQKTQEALTAKVEMLMEALRSQGLKF